MNQAVALRQRLAAMPSDVAAAAAYGRLALASGAGDTAAIWLGAAAGVAPGDRSLSSALTTLGHAYLAAGLFAAAAHALRRAAAANPDDWRAWSDYGVAQDRRGDAVQAEAAFRVACALEPGAALAVINLADRLFRSRRYEAAARVAARASQDAEALATHGNALLRLGRAVAGAGCFRRAAALSPALAAASGGLGTAHMAEEEIEPAGAWWQRAAAIAPEDVATNNNLATWHLTRGDLACGFALYEWRWRRPEAGRRRQGLPEWQGGAIAGRRVLVYQEQGLGDALQMARFVPELARRGAAVELECGDALRRLFASLADVERLRAPGEPTAAELQVALMSLPRLFGTTLATIPRAVPYLAADAALMRAVEPWLAGGSRRVGLVWQGNPRQVDEPYRSVPLAALLPLLDLPVTVFGLQRDHGREQLGLLAGRANFIDLGPRLDDLATTAAVMAQLDLVITPCTATAHLAGALGRPVWILLKRGADWRWLLERSDSPWYPTATLIRQRRSGDWQEVGRRVAAKLRGWLA
jgi:Flp pilus assembly protein TadD